MEMDESKLESGSADSDQEAGASDSADRKVAVRETEHVIREQLGPAASGQQQQDDPSTLRLDESSHRTDVEEQHIQNSQ